MSDWIAVEDQLPDDELTVLIALSDGEVWTGYHDDDQWRYVSADLVEAGKVTHWMDFPEPPVRKAPAWAQQLKAQP
jgi:hypothetical protein